MDVRPPFAVEGRSQIVVTHLALLGVKISGPAFWGYLKDKTHKTRKLPSGDFLSCVIKIPGREERIEKTDALYITKAKRLSHGYFSDPFVCLFDLY